VIDVGEPGVGVMLGEVDGGDVVEGGEVVEEFVVAGGVGELAEAEFFEVHGAVGVGVVEVFGRGGVVWGCGHDGGWWGCGVQRYPFEPFNLRLSLGECDENGKERGGS